MPQQKRNREWVSSRAKAAAIEAARRRRRRRRLIAAIAVGVLVLALVGSAAMVTRDSGAKTTATTVPLSTTSAPAESAAGKPCVDVVDDLPPGAPAVPVQVGPPPTTLITQDLKQGDGPEVTPGQTVTANYIGVSCSTGKIFDSSWTRGKPASFSLQKVIPGWQTGIPGMKVGGQRLLGIPPDLAYGDNPPSPDIAPGETLWFVVDLVAAS